MFPLRFLARPFSYIYKRLVEVVRKKRERSDSVSPILEKKQGSINNVVNDEILENPIRPPFPLRIRIPTENHIP